MVELQSTESESVKNGILQVLQKLQIDSSNVVWLAFDGASNMSGKNAGTQALLIKNHTQSAMYVHCRAHLLQLVCVYASEKFPEIKRLFSTLGSLWRLLYNSPKNLRQFKAIQSLLEDPDIKLVRAGNTRWTSHFK
jgi:hypothetical protein